VRHHDASDPSENGVWLLPQQGVMTFAIHASKSGQSVVTVRIRADATVDKARLLESLGWQVRIKDAAGHQFGLADFERLLLIDRETSSEKAVQGPFSQADTGS